MSRRLAPNTIIEKLLEYSYYDKDRGAFIRTKYTRGPQDRQQLNCPIGYDVAGYLRVEVFDKGYFIHHIIWTLETGSWPHEIDHIDGDKRNNHISNLRDVAHGTNMRNVGKLFSTNTTGYKGVVFHTQRAKYQATVTAKGKRHSAGLHHTPEQAYETRLALIAQHPEWGFTEDHG